MTRHTCPFCRGRNVWVEKRDQHVAPHCSNLDCKAPVRLIRPDGTPYIPRPAVSVEQGGNRWHLLGQRSGGHRGL